MAWGYDKVRVLYVCTISTVLCVKGRAIADLRHYARRRKRYVAKCSSQLRYRSHGNYVRAYIISQLLAQLIPKLLEVEAFG